MEVDKNQIKSWESVSKIFDPENPDRIMFQFATYGWSFPSQFRDGMHKNGITKQTVNPGNKRMTEACSGKKTAIPEEPFVIQNSEIVWSIPFEISNGLLTEANKFARKFDIECNKALSPYKVKLPRQRMVGEEWYRLSVPGVTEIREKVWAKLIGRELAKKEADAKNAKKSEIKLKPGLQEEAHQAVLDQLRLGTVRFKGIAPTGFGKTVLAWKIFTDAYAQGIITGNVSIMTAPSQFLCNKNSVAFDTYNSINGIKGIVNQPIFSGQDVGIFENENELTERRSRLEKQIEGHIKSGSKVILHVCINSMKLVSEVLEALGIPALDLMVVDEAHTLASHRNNGDDTYTGTIRNFCLFDENIRVSHRFFLTATEKNLLNPEILNEDQNFAYMNNNELFGGYAFQYSYAQCVVAGLIVPFRCKVFEYSDTTKDVVKLIATGVDRFILDDLAIRDNEGDVGQVSINLIRVLVSSLKVIEERNKMLLIVSRNTHADVLERALEILKENPNYAFLSGVNINKITTPYYPKPEARHDELEIIHESDEKHIIICGPWAITGTDCPSIDAVLWGFNPGTEITSAQGTGRGTRTHEGKEDLLVSFNLDLQSKTSDIRDNLYRTIYKLNEGLFPSHDLELSLKIRKLIGRTFLEVEKDNEAVIKPEVRKLLDEFYEAANGVELFNFVNSSAFRNGKDPDYIKFKEKLFQEADDFIRDCEAKRYTSVYAGLELRKRWGKLAPYESRRYANGVYSRERINRDYDVSAYGEVIKDWMPIYESIEDIYNAYTFKFGVITKRLIAYVTESEFKKFVEERGIKSTSELNSFYKENIDYCKKIGIPNITGTQFVRSGIYSKEFIDTVLIKKSLRKDFWDREKCLLIKKEIEEGYKDIGFKLHELFERENIASGVVYSYFKRFEIDFPVYTNTLERILPYEVLKNLVECEFLSSTEIADKFNVSRKGVANLIKKYIKEGMEINYIQVRSRKYLHSCGKITRGLGIASQHSKGFAGHIHSCGAVTRGGVGNASQHSKKCGCTYRISEDHSNGCGCTYEIIK